LDTPVFPRARARMCRHPPLLQQGRGRGALEKGGALYFLACAEKCPHVKRLWGPYALPATARGKGCVVYIKGCGGAARGDGPRT
jgi:hypothetical protein